MTILVTGSSGAIGKYLIGFLNMKEYEVYGIDKNYGNYTTHVFDLSDRKLLEIIFDRIRPETVVHLAGRIYIGEDALISEKYYIDNVVPTINLLYCMTKYGTKNIIFSSTSAIYESSDEPITEHFPINPISPYSNSKYISETIIKDVCARNNLNYTIFRFFNVGGVKDSGKPTHLVPLIIDKYQKGETFEIYGTTYSTKDGTCIRDYIHVDDIARAIELVLYNCIDKVFNLGSGCGYSVREIIEAFNDVMNDKLKVCEKEPRSGDKAYLCADYSFFYHHYGWEPKKSIKDMIISIK